MEEELKKATAEIEKMTAVLKDAVEKRQIYKKAARKTFLLAVVELFIFYSILGEFSSRFEEVVICFLGIILFKLNFESVLSDVRETDNELLEKDSARTWLLLSGSVPYFVAILSLLYLVFLT